MDSMLTLKDLLEMGSGINFSENYISPFAYPAEGYYTSDLMHYTLKYKVDTIPGKRFIYLSGNTSLLGYCVSKAVGKSLAEYTSEKLSKPLGPSETCLLKGPSTIKESLKRHFVVSIPMHAIFTHRTKLPRFGPSKDHIENVADSMGINYPIWLYKQLVPKQWVVASTTPKLVPYYGYQWWILKFEGHTIPYCRGLQGQYIMVIPDKQMVVVRLAAREL